MLSTNNVSFISGQLFAQQAAQTKVTVPAANSPRVSFADALNAVNASVGVDKTSTTVASGNTSLSITTKSALSSGTAAVATTDITSSMATSLLNILT